MAMDGRTSLVERDVPCRPPAQAGVGGVAARPAAAQSAPSRERSNAARTRGATAPLGGGGKAPVNERSE